MTCNQCIYWKESMKYDTHLGVGECMVNPPQMFIKKKTDEHCTGNYLIDYDYVRPMTKKDDWCKECDKG